MIISLASYKGGTGKTHTATNISAYLAGVGNRVLLIDTDPNETAFSWTQRRPFNDVEGLAREKAAWLAKWAKSFEKQYDYIVIDTAPGIDKMNATVLLLSDFVVLPLLASFADVEVFNDKWLPKLYQAAGMNENLRSAILLNMIDPRERAAQDIRCLVDKFDMPVLTNQVQRRTAYKQSFAKGLSVMESNNSNARLEFLGVGKELIQLFNLK